MDEQAGATSGSSGSAPEPPPGAPRFEPPLGSPTPSHPDATAPAPATPPAATGPVILRAAPQQSRFLIFACVLMAASSIMFSVLWLRERDRNTKLTVARNELQRQVDDQLAAQRAIPDLKALAARVNVPDQGVTWSGDSRVVTVELETGATSSDAKRWLSAYLDALALPPSTFNEMVATKPGDGTRSAHAGHVVATWTRGDKGLEILFRAF